MKRSKSMNIIIAALILAIVIPAVYYFIRFNEKGYVKIKVTARDEKGALSETAELRIQVPRNKVYFNSNFKQFIRLISLFKYLFFSFKFF